MGCGCKQRGQALKSAATQIARGNLSGTTGRIGVVAASAAKDIRRLVLVKAKLKAKR